MNSNRMIQLAFLKEASNILGESDRKLSGSKIVKYFSKKSYKTNTNIPYSDYPFPKEVPNKRTALYKNLIEFSSENQYEIIKDLCELKIFDDDFEVRDLKIKLITRYGQFANQKAPKYEFVKIEGNHWLSDYPRSRKHYELAVEKYRNKIYERNLLDDLRLAIELLLKDILSNNKSLENQSAEIGAYQKNKGSSPEIRNMFLKLLNYYSKYQNSYVKHNDAVNLDEVELMMDLSETFMKHLIK